MIRPVLAFTVVLAAGCSTVRVHVPLSNEDAASVTHDLEGRIAWVKLRDEPQVAYGRDFAITPSSASWTPINPDGTRTPQRQAVPPEALDRIVSQQHGRGAVDGLLVGAGLGAGLSLLALIRDPPGEAAPLAPLFVLGSSAAVGLVGALIGALIGHTSKVEFAASSP